MNSRSVKRTKDGRRQERLNTELLFNILQSNAENVKSLLGDGGANPNSRCRSSNVTASHIAALRGEADILRELIAAGANIKSKDNRGCQPVHFAAWAGYRSAINLIIQTSPDQINTVVKYEEVPFIVEESDSWNHNHAEVTELLPEISEGSSPLHIASSLCRKLTIEFLLSKNADVHLKDCQGLTPLDVAGLKAGNSTSFQQHDKIIKDPFTHHNLPMMYSPIMQHEGMNRAFLSQNTSHSHSRRGSTEVLPIITGSLPPKLYPSISMIENPVGGQYDYLNDGNDFNSIQEGSTTLDIMKLLVGFGAKVKTEVEEEETELANNPVTTLHTAVLNNDLKLIDWLLEENQCDHMLIIANEDGDTPLHVAVKKQFLDALRNMISWLDLDTLNKTDKNGFTSLYLAVQHDWMDGVGLLLEAGADVKVKTVDNDTVIDLAVRKNSPKLLEELLMADEEPELLAKFLEQPLLTAIEDQNLMCLKIILEYEVNVDVKFDDMGTTPLIKAALENWTDGVAVLLNFSADVKLKTKRNESAYHIASKFGNFRMLDILLQQSDYCLVINDTDENFFTPLFYAIGSGSLECVRSLIQSDAQLDSQLPNNTNILHFAVQNHERCEKIIEWICKDSSRIVKFKALVNKDNDDGLTPFEMAARNGSIKVVESMLSLCPVIAVNRNGTSAPHLAARHGYNDTLEILIRYNSECISLTNARGWTPLHVAARSGYGNCVIVLLKYGADVSATIKIDKTTKSALDLIVDYVPMAKQKFSKLFDSYISDINPDKTDGRSSIKMDYSLLVGTCYKEDCDHHKSASSLLRICSHEGNSSMQHRKGKQMVFIKTLLNTTNEDFKETLMLHPLVETFLYFKWDNMKCFFIILLMLYIAYTILLIAFSFLKFSNSLPTINLAVLITLLAVLSPILITELIHATTLPYCYFYEFESWLKIFMIMTGIMVSCISSELEASRYVVSLSILNSWTVLLFLLARFPAWGLHILMFEKVAYNVVEVLSRFIFLFVGFLLAFIIHFNGDPPFGNVWEAMCKVMVMLFELDYAGVFEKGEVMTLHALVGRFMFIAFGLLVAMVMVNLIVGLSVSDIAQLEKQGRSQRLAKQTTFLVSLELIVYSDWLVKCLPKSLKNSVHKYRKVECKKTIQPDDPNSPFSAQCKEALLHRGGEDDANQITIEECYQKIESIAERMDSLEKKISKIMDVITFNKLREQAI